MDISSRAGDKDLPVYREFCQGENISVVGWTEIPVSLTGSGCIPEKDTKKKSTLFMPLLEELLSKGMKNARRTFVLLPLQPVSTVLAFMRFCFLTEDFGEYSALP